MPRTSTSSEKLETAAMAIRLGSTWRAGPPPVILKAPSACNTPATVVNNTAPSANPSANCLSAPWGASSFNPRRSIKRT